MEKRKYAVDDNDAQLASSKVSEWVKKTFLTGVGAVFMTEEGIRNALSDIKMPKNVIAAAVAQADKTKQEISSLVAKEIRQFLDRIKVEDIIQKVLDGQAIEITATIRFTKHKKKAAKKTAKNEDLGEV